MPEIHSTLISASAGTGKTYRLSLRFLALLCLGVPPEKIAAITFTRKAAGEFADRILNDLARGASSADAAHDLAARIRQTLEGSDDEPGLCPGIYDRLPAPPDQRRFRELLARLVGVLGRLNLSTIDSLFSKMASALILELGVSGFSVIDTTAEEQEKRLSLLALYRDCARNAEEENALRELFIEGMRSDAEASDMGEAMERLIATYHELYLDYPDPRQWGDPHLLGISEKERIPRLAPEDFPAAVARIRDYCSGLKREHAAGETKKAEKEINSHNTKLNNCLKFWEPFADYPISRDIDLGSIDLQQKRASFAAFSCPDMDDLLQSWLALETERACARTRAAFSLISLFEEKYAEAVRNQGKFLFHDVTRLLKEDQLDQQARQNLQYRMDCRFDHWMLDEFQDTSSPQWTVLKPFLEEIAMDDAGDRSLFVVGDVKQSIYQWRGGDPALFSGLTSREPWRTKLQEMRMNTSYRSAQPVLDLVNLVCDFTSTASGCHPGALAMWGTFSPHTSARPDLPGCAQIREAVQTEEEENAPAPNSKQEPVYQAVAEILRETAPLERGLTCALLVSSNKEAQSLKQWLVSQPDRFAVETGEDTLVGTDSPLGLGLCQFFSWLRTPGDDFLQKILDHSPLSILLHVKPSPGDSWTWWNDKRDRQGISAVMKAVSALLKEKGITLSDFQKSRENIWLEEAETFDADAGGDLDAWIRHMRGLKRREDPGDDLIRIMTIHKAKGLEFDIVILPILDKKSFTSKTHLSTLKTPREDETAPGRPPALLLAPPKIIYDNQPSLKKMVEDWESDQQYEGFCKLYVALTRAAHATYAVLPVPPAKESGQDDSFRALLKKAADDTQQDRFSREGASRLLLSLGNPDWFESFPQKKAVAATPLSPDLPPPPVRLARLTPSSSGSPVGSPPSSLFEPRPSAGREDAAAFGTAVHERFREISWLDTDPLPAWLSAPRSREEQVVASCLEIPEIRALFSRPNNEAELYREQPVEAIDGDYWISATLDRLVLSPGGAHIIDFKTDKISRPEELKERHRFQMETYRSLVARLTGLPSEKIRVTLLSTWLRTLIRL